MATLNDILKDFGEDIVKSSLDNLGKDGRLDTGKLYKSVKFVVLEPDEDVPQLTFEMESYGKYLDQGVSGTKKKRGAGKIEVWPGGTMKGYTTKMPPIKNLEEWGKRNMGESGLGYVLSKHIFEQGIKATYWFTKAYNKHTKNMDKAIDEWFDEVGFFDEDE